MRAEEQDDCSDRAAGNDRPYNTRQATRDRKRTDVGDGRTRPVGKNKPKGILGVTVPMAQALQAADWTSEYLLAQQRGDADIAPALIWMESQRPDWRLMQSKSPALRALWQQYESLVTRDGVLYRIYHDVDGAALFYQLILPAA
jgi:hypothetical protein